jgi:tRNA nucleotidyltransferase (CCA-adding enzyme)
MGSLFEQTYSNHRLELSFSLLSVSSALSPETWPFSLDWLPESAFLVGGSVRDVLLGRQSDYLDLDFVLPQGAVETAKAIARRCKAGFVLLDAERQIARVVFPQGTADFAAQVGPTLEADLRRRDFTINAIAYNPHTDQLFDPLRGYADLQQHRIRMVSPENLEEDPLRLLRAYRQAAQLGFSLEPQTQSVIRQLAPLLSRIAAERIQSELNYLLNNSNGTVWLITAWKDGLLQDWLPSATGQSLSLLAAIDQAAVVLKEVWPEFAAELLERIRNSPKAQRTESSGPSIRTLADTAITGTTRNWLTLAKLSSLLPPDLAEAEAQLRRLKYSRNEVQAIHTILKYLPQLCTLDKRSPVNLASSAPEPVDLERSLRQQCLFFQAVGPTFPAVAVMAIAAGVTLESISPFLQRFLTPDDPVAHPTPLVSGQDVMALLKLPPGPRIGQLLAELQLARAEGKVTNRQEALQLAAQLATLDVF